MRRAIVIAITGASLAGCSSLSLDAFRSAPPPVQVALESAPPGADARTSLGPGCTTPCSVSLTAPESGFSVSYTLDKFQPATVSVQVTHTPGDLFAAGSTKIDPNPVFAELQPAAPPPKPVRKKRMRPRKPKPPRGATAKGATAAPAPAGSPFPQPQAPAAPAPATPPPAAPQPAAPSR